MQNLKSSSLGGAISNLPFVLEGVSSIEVVISVGRGVLAVIVVSVVVSLIDKRPSAEVEKIFEVATDKSTDL